MVDKFLWLQALSLLACMFTLDSDIQKLSKIWGLKTGMKEETEGHMT